MILITRIALLCYTLLCIHPAHAGKQEDLDKLRQRISSLQQEMEKTSGSRSETLDALRESELAISTGNRILHKLASQQRAANLDLGQVQQKAKQLSAEMREQQLLLAKLLHQQYLGGGQEYFLLLLNNRDPNQAARELRYYEYIAHERAAWLKAMRGNLTQLNTITAQARQKNLELAAMQTEQAAQQKSLLKQKTAHQQLLKKIALQLKQQRQEIGRLQRDENHLAKLLAKLARIAAEPRPGTAPKNNIASGDRSQHAIFTSLRGKLRLPVKGKITNQYGSRRPDSTVLWKGLFVQSSASQPVQAVAPGRVIFADWLRGFGNLLIIDHGAGYMSLYGNNETLYKQVGDELQGGDTIAAVGNSGGNENYGLYFELRHEGLPLNPSEWLKGRPSKAR